MLPNWMRLVDRQEQKSITFDGSAGAGAVGTVEVFPISGHALMDVLVADCKTSLVGSGATISLGTSGNPAGLFSSVPAEDLDAGKLWSEGGPSAGLAEPISGMVVNETVILTIAGANITAGKLNFTCIWRPLGAVPKVG